MSTLTALQQKGTFGVNSNGRDASAVDAALGWADRLGVQVGGAGTVAGAGVVLPRLLADRLGLTEDLARVAVPGRVHRDPAPRPGTGRRGVRARGGRDVPE